MLFRSSLVSHFHWQEHLVVVKLQGVIDNEFLYSCDSANCRLLVSDYMHIYTLVLGWALTMSWHCQEHKENEQQKHTRGCRAVAVMLQTHSHAPCSHALAQRKLKLTFNKKIMRTDTQVQFFLLLGVISRVLRSRRWHCTSIVSNPVVHTVCILAQPPSSTKNDQGSMPIPFFISNWITLCTPRMLLTASTQLIERALAFLDCIL